MGEVSVSLEKDVKEGVLVLDKNLEEKIMDMTLQAGIIQNTLDTRILRASMVQTGRANMYRDVSRVGLPGQVMVALKQCAGGSLSIYDQLWGCSLAVNWREKYLGQWKELSLIHH